VAGRRYADLMSERVWQKIGAERSAYITLDRLGAPRCAGLPMRYASQWYVLEGMVFGWGIHGQHLFVDRANELVIAKFSSQALPIDTKCIGLTLRAVSQLRKLLA